MTDTTEVRLDDLDLIDDDEEELPVDQGDEAEAEAGMSLDGPPKPVVAGEIEFEDETGAPA